jgi:hypothetical protein
MREHKTSQCVAIEHFLIMNTQHSMQKFFKSSETFAWGPSSIRVQPERRAALGQSEIFNKNPAVAAAGP